MRKFYEKKQWMKQCVAFLMSLCLLVTMLPSTSWAYTGKDDTGDALTQSDDTGSGDDTDGGEGDGSEADGEEETTALKSINLGAKILEPKAQTNAAGKTVYWWGTDGNKNEVQFGARSLDKYYFRVLKSPDDSTLFLDCSDYVKKIYFGSDGKKNAEQPNYISDWKGSDVEAYLNGEFYSSAFDRVEKAAIRQTYLDDVDANDYVFSLSADEVLSLYGSKYIYAKTGDWFLRTAYGKNLIRCVNRHDGVDAADVKEEARGVSPALYIDLDRVLFSVDVKLNTQMYGGDLFEVTESTSSTWFLPSLDDRLSVSLQDGEKVIATSLNGTVTVSVPWEATDDTSIHAEQISIMITDKKYTDSDAQVLYYGCLNGQIDTETFYSSADSFELPSELTGKICGKDYHAYILAAECDNNSLTDRVSVPFEISIPESTEHTHSYTDVSYVWSEDYSTCTAARTCSVCKNEEKEIVDAYA